MALSRAAITAEAFSSFGRLLPVTVLFAGGAGCGQILGVDDYRVDPGAGPTADVGGRLPILPALPDADLVTGCEACVRANCSDLRNTCLASPRCKAMLACQSACEDPACIAECQSKWPHSDAFDAYFGCAFGVPTYAQTTVSQCLAECGAGQNFECSRTYKWAAQLPSISLDLHLIRGLLAGFSPLSVMDRVEGAACSDTFVPSAGSPPFDFGCDQSRWVPVGDYGALPLAFSSTQNVIAIRSTPGGAGERHRFYLGPIAPARPMNLIVDSLLPDSAFFISASATGQFDPTLGVIGTVLYDCLGILAVSNTTLDPPGTAQRFYPGERPTATAPNPPGSSASFLNVQPGPAIRVLAAPVIRDGAPTPPPSEKTVIVAAAAVTEVYLYPAEQ